MLLLKTVSISPSLGGDHIVDNRRHRSPPAFVEKKCVSDAVLREEGLGHGYALQAFAVFPRDQPSAFLLGRKKRNLLVKV